MFVSSMGPASSPCSPLQREHPSVVSVLVCFVLLFFCCLFMCARICVCGRVQMHCGWAEVDVGIFLIALCLIFDAVPLTEPGAHQFAILLGEQALCIILSLPSPRWDCRCTLVCPAFVVCVCVCACALGFSRSECLGSNHLADESSSQPPGFDCKTVSLVFQVGLGLKSSCFSFQVLGL